MNMLCFWYTYTICYLIIDDLICFDIFHKYIGLNKMFLVSTVFLCTTWTKDCLLYYKNAFNIHN